MRNFLIAALLLLAAGGPAHAQYFSFNAGSGGPIEIVIRARMATRPASMSMFPVMLNSGGETHRRRVKPITGRRPVTRNSKVTGRRAHLPTTPMMTKRPSYAPPPATRRPIRQPRQFQAAPKKKLPKVAAVHDASPAKATANPTAAPTQKPIPEVAPGTAKPPATPQNSVDGQLPSTPKPGATPAPAPTPIEAMTPAPKTPAPTPPVADNPAPAQAAPSGAVAVPAVAASPNPAPPSTSAEIAPEKPSAGTARAPEEATAPLPPPEPTKTQTPPTVVAANNPKAESDPSPSPQSAAKPSQTTIAALPPAKKDLEERAKPTPAMPIGVWSSSDGQMRVERCGQNLCGYAVGGKHAGKMVLIHMRSSGNNHWSGQVNDVRSGQNYSATMSMRGPNALNIRGCALGGLFCGSRTMSRVQ